MSAPAAVTAPGPIGRSLAALTDGWVIVRRDLAHFRYAPTELLGHLAFPVVMVVLFGYVLGGAIQVPGGDYREYLMPGLFAFGQITAAASAAVTTADDAARGVMDRLRAMPIARFAVPFGRTGAELATGILNLAALAACGLIVGWQPHRSLAHTAAAFALLLLMRYAMSWVGVYLGLLVKNPGTADSLVPLTFPAAMLSNAFVPSDGMPGWLQAIADYNPVSCLVASRPRTLRQPDHRRRRMATAASGHRHPGLDAHHPRGLRPTGHPPLPHRPPLTSTAKRVCAVKLQLDSAAPTSLRATIR